MVTDINYYFNYMTDFPISNFFDNLSYPWQALEQLNKTLDSLFVQDIQDIRGDNKGGSYFYGSCFIDEGSVIYNGVTIMGPVYIGKNCELMPGTIIRPYSIIGDNCVMGHGCEIKHSLVMNGAKIQSTSFVGDSVIGKSARIGSGAIVANRKFNQSNISVKNENSEIIDLNTSFFGCVIGDYSRLGANSVTQPGTHIGPYSWIYPATNVRGFIPRNKRVFHDKPITLLDNDSVTLAP